MKDSLRSASPSGRGAPRESRKQSYQSWEYNQKQNGTLLK